MTNKTMACLMAGIFFFAVCAFSQVATKTGSVYGKVTDDQKNPLPGVTVTLESTLIPSQTAVTGSTGGFRFANLPPGPYSLNFSLEGFTELRQEDVRVSIGSTVELSILLKPSLSEEFTVIGETPTVDTTQTGNESTYGRSYLDEVPSGRDPWVILDQTPGIDNDRYNVAGSESGQQSGFFSRGGSDLNNQWNIDGINSTDPVALGATPEYFDFDSFEELQVASGGNDASIQTSGVVLNIVSKRAGNNWAGNGSGYFVNHDLQGNNTPEELVDAGVERSNRINEVWEYGFDVGGPIIKDKFFAWGAYRRNQINLFTRNTNPFTGESIPDNTTLKSYNFKTNFNWNTANESLFSYFDNAKDKEGRGFAPAQQAPETLWNQGSPGTILDGIWSGQHTWIPNDKNIVTARYGYIGNSFGLIPVGGSDKPMIYQYAISRYTNTGFFISPIDRPGQDFNVDWNYYKENMLGGDHEFKFGFEYNTSKPHTFSSYGNGVYITDYYQTLDPSQPGFELTSGTVRVRHNIDGNVKINRSSFYVTDTYRRDRLTLNLGFRIDNQGGKNDASSIPSIVGFESLIGPLAYGGNDLSPSFTDVSPRIGATYDLTGNGKSVIRGNFAQYYDPWNPFYDTYANPTFVYNGFTADFDVTGQGLITLNEGNIDLSTVEYYGGLNGPVFDIADFEAKRLYDADFRNQKSREFIVGFEQELFKDTSLAVNYTYRKYDSFTCDCPFGISADSYVDNGDRFTRTTVLGNFDIPYSVLAVPQDGTHILSNIDNYSNSYNGVDIVLRKRMSNNFLLNSSLTVQRQKQNVGGGDGFFGATTGDGLTGRVVEPDPSLVGFYNDLPYAYVSGGSGKSGVYPYSEWTLRMSGVYQFPAEISVGAFGRYQQGYPYVLFGQVDDGSFSAFDGSARVILLEPIGDRRYDNTFTLDLNVQKVFSFGNAGRLTLAADLFNVTNNNSVVQRNRLANSSTFNVIQENISPRALRFGVRYSF